MTNQQKWKALSKRLDEIEAYGRCLGKVNFDMECCAPEEGIEKAGEDMAILGRRLYQMTHSKTFERLVCELHARLRQGLRAAFLRAAGRAVHRRARQPDHARAL